MKTTSRLLLLALVLLAVPAGASGPNKYIDQSASAFAALDFEGALGLLEKALARPGNNPGDLVRIYSLRGLCLLSLGRDSQARRAFRAALSIDPSFRLAPDLSPRFQEPFRKVLDQGVEQISLDIELPREVAVGQPLEGRARLLSDPERLARRLVLRFRRQDQRQYSSLRLQITAERPASIRFPTALLGGAAGQAVEWYAELQDGHGGRLLGKADAAHPLRVEIVEPQPVARAAPVPEPQPPPPSVPWWRKWWIWAIAGGVAAAAGGTAAAIVLSRPAASERDFSIEIH